MDKYAIPSQHFTKCIPKYHKTTHMTGKQCFPSTPTHAKREKKFAKLKAHKSTGTTRLGNFGHFSRAKRTFGTLGSAVNNCQATSDAAQANSKQISCVPRRFREISASILGNSALIRSAIKIILHSHNCTA